MYQYTREEIIEMLKSADCNLPSLDGVDLSRVDLREAVLLGINFGKANLRGANLRGAVLDQVNFFKTNLEGADLRGANLRGASLKEAKLWGTNLSISNLIGANMCGANLEGANLVGSNLDGTNLVGADLKGADLRGVSLRGVDLSRAKLWGANLWEADLRGSDMIEAELCSAILNQADLRGVNLSGANIWGVIRDGWKIEGINAEYIYNCATPWVNGAKEKTKQTFEPGEFEKFCKSLPTLEMLFIGGLSPGNYLKLAGLVEIIRQENPEIDLKIKSLEEIGHDTIIRLTLSRDTYLQKAITLVAQACRGRGVNQEFLFLLKSKYDIYLESDLGKKIFDDELMKNVVVNAIKQTGESHWKGELSHIDIVEQKFSPREAAVASGKLVSYNLRPAAVDALLVEGDEAKQDLTEVLVNVLRAKRKKKVTDTWHKGGH